MKNLKNVGLIEQNNATSFLNTKFKELLESFTVISKVQNNKVLISALMQIILENITFATRVFFIIKENNLFYVKASTDLTKTKIKQLTLLLDKTHDIPKTIIHAAINRGEKIVLDYPNKNKKFKFDGYLQKNKPASCTALVAKVDNSVDAVLYIEHKDSIAPLNPQTIEILELLLTQGNIAFRNNSLYESIEKMAKINARLKERMELAIVGSKDGIWDWNLLDNSIYFSSRWKEIIGFSHEYFPHLYSNWKERVHPYDLKKYKEVMQNHIDGKTEYYENTYRLKHKKGHWVWILDRGKKIVNHAGIPIRISGTNTDITKEKELEIKREKQKNILKYQARHDALTKLPNRLLFSEKLIQAIEKAKYHKDKLAIFFIDLDRFKKINDSFGHDYGDTALQIVSSRLLRMIRKEDTLARLGGDEFIVLIEKLDKEKDTLRLAPKILEVLAEPMHIKNHAFSISSSIGISFYPKDSTTVVNLLKYADVAMYKAKEMGGNKFQYY